MSDDALRELAEEAGIAVYWDNFARQPQTVSPDSLRAVLTALGYACASQEQITESRGYLAHGTGQEALPSLVTALAGSPAGLGTADLSGSAKLLLETGEQRDVSLLPGGVVPAIEETGYHRLLLKDREIVLAVAPRRAPSIEDRCGTSRVWGLAAQTYSLRRPNGSGAGDTLAVSLLLHHAARAGAQIVALSPMHALFSARPEQYGPYSPSSRLFLNPSLAAAELVFGDATVRQAIAEAGLAEEIARLESRELIDWPAVLDAKLRLMRGLFAQMFAGGDALLQLHADFARFQAEGGDLLSAHACFEALQAEQTAEDGGADWRHWPVDLRDPGSATVAAFAGTHQRDILFHAFLQWVADRSLAAAQASARRAGMGIGLVADLAVGMDPSGSHAWSRQSDILNGLTIGAPPDLFNPNGQQWGITGFSPAALRTTGFAPFLATLRACLRNAGGLRIDHAMGLQRLWLMPDGASPADGAYLRYPLTDQLRLLLLEAHRHQAIVVGEDLGTVPEGFREALDAHGIYGMRVLWFEAQGNRFRAPREWDRGAMAMTSTHDLPTAAAWWTGADIALRARQGVLGPHQQRAGLLNERQQDKTGLWQAIEDAGVADRSPPDDPQDFVDAALSFVANTNSSIALLPLEDLLGQTEQPNLPGTIDQHPNWRGRNAVTADDLLDHPRVARRIDAISRWRGAQ